jgi:hypothetical protein
LLEILDDLAREIPGGTLKGASEFLESLWCYFYTKQIKGRAYFFRGDRPYFATNSQDVLEAFLLGAAWAYHSLPAPMLEQYRDHLRKSFTPPDKRPSMPGATPL